MEICLYTGTQKKKSVQAVTTVVTNGREPARMLLAVESFKRTPSYLLETGTTVFVVSDRSEAYMYYTIYILPISENKLSTRSSTE